MRCDYDCNREMHSPELAQPGLVGDRPMSVELLVSSLRSKSNGGENASNDVQNYYTRLRHHFFCPCYSRPYRSEVQSAHPLFDIPL